MKIQIDLNNLYCSNGQWKVHLDSSLDGLKTNEVLKKIMLEDCNCSALEQRVGELEIIVLKIMFPKDYQDEFLTGKQAKLVSEIHKEALKEV